jgi:uroporphyrinogen-III synthase
MREVPLEQNEAAFRSAVDLLSRRIHAVVFLTGVGARALLDVITTRHERSRVLAALDGCTIMVRGPKPAAVLREWGLRIDHRAAEPNTWRELVQVLDEERVPLAGRTVAVQEYGRASAELYAALAERGAEVQPVPVYRWELPEDTGPLEQSIVRTIADEFDLLLFTSAQQIAHVLTVADRLGTRKAWLAAANRCVIGSIGPTASEALREEGLCPDLEPSHPKMGHLAVEACARARAVLPAKRPAPG